jgi:aspartyl/asparaginyl-tRNA synthetase
MEVVHVLRELMFYILNGLKTRYAKQTERVRKEYKEEEFLLPASAADVPIVTFAEGIAMLKAAGVTISGEEDIK